MLISLKGFCRRVPRSSKERLASRVIPNCGCTTTSRRALSILRRTAVCSVVASATSVRRPVAFTKGSHSPSLRAKSLNNSKIFPRGLKDHRKEAGVDSPPPTGPQINGTGSNDSRLGIQYLPSVTWCTMSNPIFLRILRPAKYASTCHR